MRVTTVLSFCLLLLIGCTSGTARPNAEEEAAAKKEEPTPKPIVREAPPVDAEADARTLQQRLDDASVEAAVTQRLLRESRLRVFDFDPEVVNGHLLLRGDVNTEKQARRAEQLAAQVSGVTAIHNDVLIRGAYTLAEADEKRASAPELQDDSRSNVYHTVRSGESLWTIAKKYQASVDRLKSLNDLRSGTLRPGQRLRVR